MKHTEVLACRTKLMQQYRKSYWRPCNVVPS